MGDTTELPALGAMAPDFAHLFEAMPHPYLVLRADADFTIVAVNERYLEATGTNRRDVLGRGLFEVFPDNPADPATSAVRDLHTSLRRVVRDRIPDVMGIQKYDIPARDGTGSFHVRFWSPVNTPVVEADRSVSYVIHHVEDVTDFVLAREREQHESVERLARVERRAERTEAEVLRRARPSSPSSTIACRT